MIPQEQRWFRGAVLDDEGHQTDRGGDCFAAALASILEVPITGFPNFLADDAGVVWWHRWQRWLYDNYRVELLYWEKDWPNPASLAWWIGEVYPGQVPHSVVFYKEEFRWDPAPDNAKRTYTVADVRSVVAPFSVASIFDRDPGRTPEVFDAA